MENASYSSYPDSGDSSPRSREIDDSQSWDDQPPSSNYKVKFMCSYGGKIQPRPHDNQLAYIGGDTKILSVDRNIKFPIIMSKLVSLCGDPDICFKYQLPGEDLDALISVTNDEDLEHMMLEYDRMNRASAKPARLRLFLFHLNPLSYGSAEVKSDRQWFVDALNSVQVQPLEVSSPPAAASTPDYLFGLEKGFPVPVSAAAKFTETPPAPVTMPEVVLSVGSDCGSEDRHIVGDPNLNQQIQDLQRMQISRKIEEANSRAFATEYYQQQRIPPPVTGPPPVQMPIPAAFLPERHITSTGYTISAATGTDQPVYLIPTSAGVYQQPPPVRQVAGQVSQGFYGVQRVVQEVYREQPMYNPPAPQQQAPAPPPQKVGVYEGIGMVQQGKVGIPEQGFVQVGYDSAGRQVYYTTAYPQAAAVPPVDGRQGGGAALSQDVSKIVTATATPNVKAAQTPSV